MATGWAGPRTLDVTSPQGRVRLQSSAVVLATGARERPRSARLIAGDRPPGVLTTGQLQQLVHLHGRRLPGRAVIVGSELVSWSAVLTLREAGAAVVLMTTEREAIEAYAALHLAGRAALRVPVATRARVLRIVGRDRLEAVEVLDQRTGGRRMVGCDWVVLTGDWVAENELARGGGLVMASGGVPLVDQSLASSAAGVFAVGNVAHPVETADVCALDGAHAAASVARWLRGEAPQAPAVPLEPDATLAWVSPGAVRPRAGPSPRARLLAWSREPRRLATVRLEQGGSVVAIKRLPWPASPGRVLRIPFDVVLRLDPAGGPANVGLV
jgi:thioredoxin reductase